jgi:hypothetical protein
VSWRRRQESKRDDVVLLGCEDGDYLSETLVSTYEYTRRHNPEEHRHLYRLQNLRSHNPNLYSKFFSKLRQHVSHPYETTGKIINVLHCTLRILKTIQNKGNVDSKNMAMYKVVIANSAMEQRQFHVYESATQSGRYQLPSPPPPPPLPLPRNRSLSLTARSNLMTMTFRACSFWNHLKASSQPALTKAHLSFVSHNIWKLCLQNLFNYFIKISIYPVIIITNEMGINKVNVCQVVEVSVHIAFIILVSMKWELVLSLRLR